MAALKRAKRLMFRLASLCPRLVDVCGAHCDVECGRCWAGGGACPPAAAAAVLGCEMCVTQPSQHCHTSEGAFVPSCLRCASCCADAMLTNHAAASAGGAVFTLACGRGPCHDGLVSSLVPPCPLPAFQSVCGGQSILPPFCLSSSKACHQVCRSAVVACVCRSGRGLRPARCVMQRAYHSAMQHDFYLTRDSQLGCTPTCQLS